MIWARRGAGALIGAVAVLGLGDFEGKGRVMIYAVLITGVLILGLGWFGYFAIAVPILAGLGMASAVTMALSQILMHMAVEDEYRGRVMGLRGLMWSLIPLGGLQAGLLASVIGAPLTIVLNGAVVIAFTLLAYVFSREIRNLRQLAPEATRAGPTLERADG